MTNEQLSKGELLRERIYKAKDELETLSFPKFKVMHAVYAHDDLRSYIDVPDELKDVFHDLLTVHAKKKLEALEKEFEAL